MKFALTVGSPVAVRYPRAEAYCGLEEFRDDILLGKSEMIYREKGIALLAVGSMVETGEKVREILKRSGHDCTLVNARFVKPIDEDMIGALCTDHRIIVTMEENVLSGGFGEQVTEYMAQKALRADVMNVAVPDEFVTHGSPEELKRVLGLDAEGIARRIEDRLSAMGMDDV